MSLTYQINRRLERKKTHSSTVIFMPHKDSYPITCYAGTEESQRHSSAYLQSRCQKGMDGRAMPWPLNPHAVTQYSSHRRLGGPQSQLGEVQKSDPCRGSNSRPSSPQSGTIPTTLSLLPSKLHTCINHQTHQHWLPPIFKFRYMWRYITVCPQVPSVVQYSLRNK
jgi:hypothetical protein